MKAPNCVCGVRDSEMARDSICRWPSPDITYAITGIVPGWSKEQYRAVVRESFDSWQRVCGIQAREIDTSDANLIISVGRGRRSNFDGPGGTLAWCELPCGNVRQCLLRMDLDERWTQDLVPKVLKHEIGHGIGIKHIDPRIGRALMNPVISEISEPQPLDIAEAVKLYGPAIVAPVPEPPPVTPIPPGRHKIELHIDGQLEWMRWVG